MHALNMSVSHESEFSYMTCSIFGIIPSGLGILNGSKVFIAQRSRSLDITSSLPSW